tara:strand:- start:331 stop:759 length:429 start_codon:yes stop_codon:yes gene_type:complete
MCKTKYTQCAGGIVINNNQEVAIVNQNYDSWSLPKGHVDKGESILDAAIREIYEETGITDLKLIKSLGDYGRYKIGLDGENDKSEFKTINIFLFTSNQKELKPIDPHNPEAKWIAFDKVENFLTHPNDKEFYLKSVSSFINS